jgi:hypothetical protein
MWFDDTAHSSANGETMSPRIIIEEFLNRTLKSVQEYINVSHREYANDAESA